MLKKYIFLALFVLFVFSISGAVSAANWTVGSNGTDYSSIQDAIDNSNTQENDTIIVNPKINDSYNENLIVNKAKLKLVANGTVTIVAPDLYMPVITIGSDGAGTNVNGFTLIGGTTGILILDYADNCTITGNNITIGNLGSDYSNGVDSGFMIDGGIAVESSNVTIKGNNINGNRDNVKGIMVVANNCNITQNNITNTAFGILFGGSDNCSVTNNNITECYYGIDLECNDYFFSSTNCLISQNNINNNVMNGIRISGSDGDENLINSIQITKNNINYNGNITEQKGAGIFLNLDTININISQNNIKNNWNGLELSNNSPTNDFQSPGNITINGNSIINNYNTGIHLADYNNTNNISNNIINGNIDGIGLYNNSNSTIFQNTILNNTNGVTVNNSVADIHFNRIATNNYNIVNNVGITNATNNWWGYNNISSIANKIINTGNGTVDYSTWMVLRIIIAPTTVYAGGYSNITLSLLYDNNGAYHGPSLGVIPYTETAGFGTTLGSVTNNPMVNGVANNQLNNQNSTGTATVYATIDNQTINTALTLNGPAAFKIVVKNTGSYKVRCKYYVTVYNSVGAILLQQTYTFDLNAGASYTINLGNYPVGTSLSTDEFVYNPTTSKRTISIQNTVSYGAFTPYVHSYSVANVPANSAKPSETRKRVWIENTALKWLLVKAPGLI